MKFPSSGKKFPDERKNFPLAGKKIPFELNQFPKSGNWFPIKWEISHFVRREEFLKENSMFDGNLFLLDGNEFPTSWKIFPALREFWENGMEKFPSIFLKENGLGVFPDIDLTLV